MKKVASFCFLSLMLSLGANSTFAQDSAPRRLQAGMTGNFGINMVKPTDSYFNSAPFNHDLSVGMIFNTSFKNAPNLGISTGFEFEFTKLNMKPQIPCITDMRVQISCIKMSKVGLLIY